MIGLFFGGELGGKAGDDGGGFERVSRLDESGEDIPRGNDEQGDVFAEALGDGDGLGEEHLLVFAEELFGGFDVLGTAGAHHAGGQDDEVLLVGVGVGESPFEGEGSGGVAHGDDDGARADLEGFAADGVLVLELEVLAHLEGGEVVAAFVVAFGEGEDDEEDGGEDDTADGGDGLGEEVDEGGGEEDEEDGEEAEGDFGFADPEIEGDLGGSFAAVLPAQKKHGEGVEGEAPDDAEGVGLADDDDVAMGEQDDEDLHAGDEIDDAVAGAVLLLRATEPVGEDTVFGDAHEDAGGADDGGVDGSAEDKEADDDDEDAEGNAGDVRADHVHGHAGDEVVAVDMHADGVGDDHDGEQRAQAGEEEAVDGDDEGGAFEVFELGVLDFAVDLGEGLFAAHGEDGVSEGHEDAEESEGGGEAAAFEEAEGVVAEVEVGGGGEGREGGAAMDDGEGTPGEQEDDHDGRDFHDVEGFFAGLFDALDVLPPEVDGDGDGDDGGGEIGAEVRCEVGGGVVVVGDGGGDVVEHADDVLAGGDTGDGTGEDVVEHEGGDAEFGEGSAEGLLDDAIDAAAGEHGAAFDVDGADGEGEGDDAEDEPGSGLADGLLGDTAGVEGGGAEIVEDDGGGSPEGDKGEHDRGRHDEANTVGLREGGNFGR